MIRGMVAFLGKKRGYDEGKYLEEGDKLMKTAHNYAQVP
jgi:hypothetical protein